MLRQDGVQFAEQELRLHDMLWRCINMGDLQILEYFSPKEWRLTSGNVYQPVRLCLSCKWYRRAGRHTTGGLFCPGLTVLLPVTVEGRHRS